MAAAHLLMILVISALSIRNGLAQICLSPMGSPGPQLPQFPDQFSTEIEANIGRWNLTLRVTEYYDNINSRGRIDSYAPSGPAMNITLANYTSMEVSHIMTSDDGTKSCFAAPLAANSSRFARRRFGPQFDNGTVQFVTTSEFLRFGEEYNKTYIGPDMVRGIPCHQWQSCNITEGGRANFTVDYYFTQSGWSDYPNMIPVQVIVNGTRLNTTSNDIYDVYNVYSFINFRPGPVDDDVFRVPPGQPCMGRQIGKALPPLPDDYYSVLYESVDEGSRTITYLRAYYIQSQQLFRVDLNTGFPNSTTLIEDFNEGVQYYINSRYGNCSISRINIYNSTAVALDPDGTLHLESLKEHFLRRNESSYSYEGVSRLRGVDTESWISLPDKLVFNNQSSITNGYIQVYYTQPTWSVSSSFNSYSNQSVPWEYKVSGTYSFLQSNGTWITYNDTNIYHVLEFQTVEPDFDVFDASICFGICQYTLMRLSFPLPAGTPFTSIDHTQLRSKIRTALSQAAGVSASRIGSINIYQRSNDSISVYLHVLDAPPYSIRQNVKPRDEIVLQLMEKVNSGMVSITLGQVTIQPSIIMLNNSNTACNNGGNQNNNVNSVSSNDDSVQLGTVVALSIGLFIVGLIVGIAVTFLLRWLVKYSKNKYNVSSYNKHQDEMVNN